MSIKIDLQKIDDSIPQTLPLIDYVANKYQFQKNLPFKNYKILAVQHLLGSSIPMFEMLVQGGADPANIYIVGKAYSSHPKIAYELKKRGYQIDIGTLFENFIDQPYDTTLERHIISTTNKLLKDMTPNMKGLIIDDGGKAIKLLHKSYPQIVKNFKCIEQTSRGSRVVEALKLECPVVNVARSKTKTIHESPFIAKGMVHEFINSLKQWDDEGTYLLRSKNVLLLGYGFIGENVAKELRFHNFKVVVYDPDDKKNSRASIDGFLTTNDKNNMYKDKNIIVGATGTEVLSPEDLPKIESGTLLVSMASTDTEFSAWKLRPSGKIIHQNILESDTKYLSKFMPLPWRSLYKINIQDKYVLLVNGGFPSDFSGKVNPIPAKDIQLTSALLLCGSLQATETTAPGMTDLDNEIQSDIIEKFKNLGGNAS